MAVCGVPQERVKILHPHNKLMQTDVNTLTHTNSQPAKLYELRYQSRLKPVTKPKFRNSDCNHYMERPTETQSKQWEEQSTGEM